MNKIKLSEIAKITNGKLIGKDITVDNISIDSRNIDEKSLFVPLIDNRDGHQFIKNAFEKGNASFISNKDYLDLTSEDKSYIVVDDNFKGLKKLAKYYLDEINPKKIAVTGSNGKTSVKDMASKVLEAKYKVFKTPGNLNSEIGVPLSVLMMPSDTEILVVELGMDRPGQIRESAKLIRPNFGIITMVGEAHIEFFKTRTKIIDAKLEIMEFITDTLFFDSSDDKLTELILKKNEIYNLSLSSIKEEKKLISGVKQNGSFLEFYFDNNKFSVPVFGMFNINNILLVTKVSMLLKISINVIIQQLNILELTDNRSKLTTLENGIEVVNDIYNSNPTALKEMIKNFSLLNNKEKKSYLIIGDMLELGNDTKKFHLDIANMINDENFDTVFLVGNYLNSYTKPALQEKFKNKLEIVSLKNENVKENKEILGSTLSSNSRILLKGSRGNHLEDIFKIINELNF